VGLGGVGCCCQGVRRCCVVRQREGVRGKAGSSCRVHCRSPMKHESYAEFAKTYTAFAVYRTASHASSVWSSTGSAGRPNPRCAGTPNPAAPPIVNPLKPAPKPPACRAGSRASALPATHATKLRRWSARRCGTAAAAPLPGARAPLSRDAAPGAMAMGHIGLGLGFRVGEAPKGQEGESGK
jgi:hypothetical protein